ncbi:MAG: hypothetical protein K9L30_18175 [Desulfobacterales bacterium]|nr:hypothetical protein [Desulfobacterales bacterium]
MLTTPEMCLTNAGDGIGGIGNIFTLKQEVDESGFVALFGDTRSSDKVGFGLSAPAPQSLYWKWNLGVLSQIFSPEDVYDVNGIIAFTLIGLFSFILLKELGVSFIFSFIGALLLTHIDHFFSRLNGHLLGLGTYFIPILLCWGAVWAGKKPTLFRMLILAFLNVFNFWVNEYYGYYGFFFSYGLFLGYFLKFADKPSFLQIKTGVWFILSGIFFVSAMTLSYPHIVLGKIAELIQIGSENGVPVHNASHPWNEFLVYSVRKPMSLFSPWVPWLKQVVVGDVFKSDLGEFTFRIGTAAPVAILACILFFGYFYIFHKNEKSKVVLWECIIWMAVSALMVIFALDPRHYISLVPITFKIAPMFRVGARAFLYVDIAVIVLFVYTIDALFCFILKRLVAKKSSIVYLILNVALIVILIFITAIGIIDIARDRIWNKVPSLKLPDTSIYEVLRDKPPGLLLELPMYSPIKHSPEKNYLYKYYRTTHGFPIVNTSYPLPTNLEFRDILHRLSNYINTISYEVLKDLKLAGVRYIVVDRRKIDDSRLRESPGLKLIGENENKSIFSMKTDKLFGRYDFLEHFVYSEPTLSLGGDFKTPQNNDRGYWVWCGRAGKIILKNHSKFEKEVNFEAIFVLKPGHTLVIESCPYLYETIKSKRTEIDYRRILRINAESSLLINISSDAPPFNPRYPDLIFCMYEYKVEKVNH